MSFFRRHPGGLASVALLLLAAYLVASMGLLPSPRIVMGWLGHMSAERYPCENCGCGCASAAECWTHCCCHSEHERLVWAIENGVMPPPVARFSDEQWMAAANAIEPGSAECVMCVAQVKSKLRRGIAMRPVGDAVCGGGCDGHCGQPSCSKETPGKSAGCASCDLKDDAGTKTSWPGPSISALSCKGLSQLFMLTLPPSPPVRVVVFILPEPTPFVPERPGDMICSTRTLDVPEPPPRMIDPLD